MSIPALNSPTRNHSQHFIPSSIALTGLICLILFIVLTLPMNSVSALPQHTPPALPTRPAGQPTRQYPDATRTVELPTTPLITRTPEGKVAATVEYLTTSVAINLAEVQATAQALLTALPTLPSDFDSQDLIDWLRQLVETGQVTYDPTNDTLTISASLSESSLDKIIEGALIAVDYDVSQVTVDLVNGAIVITAQNVELSDQLTGTLQLTLTLSVVNGQIVINVAQATLNGIPIPSSLLDDMIASIQGALGSLGTTPPGDADYTVESLIVTDDAITLIIVIALPTNL